MKGRRGGPGAESAGARMKRLGETRVGTGVIGSLWANLRRRRKAAGKTGRYERGRAGRQKSTTIQPAAATMQVGTHGRMQAPVEKRWANGAWTQGKTRRGIGRAGRAKVGNNTGWGCGGLSPNQRHVGTSRGRRTAGVGAKWEAKQQGAWPAGAPFGIRSSGNK